MFLPILEFKSEDCQKYHVQILAAKVKAYAKVLPVITPALPESKKQINREEINAKELLHPCRQCIIRERDYYG
jgi:hypothetical protein